MRVTRPAPEGLVFRIIASPAQDLRAERVKEEKESRVGNVLVGRVVHSGYGELEMGHENSYICGHKGFCGGRIVIGRHIYRT